MGASFVSLGTTLAIQVVQVPFFLHYVGVHEYSAWLVLTAVPTYLSLSDLGFSGAASTAAAQRLVAGDDRGARERMQSAWSLVMSVVGLAAVVGIPLFLLLFHPEASSQYAGVHARTIVICQLVAVAAWIQAGFIEGAFRASGRYPLGIFLMTCIRVAEFVALVSSLAIWRNLWISAAALAGTRLLLVIVYYLVGRRLNPWFALGWSDARLRLVARLAGPSLTYAGFTFGFGILNQGYLLLAASRLSAAEVVTFTTVRTIVNSTQQVTVTVTNGVLGELTRAVAAWDFTRARKIAFVAGRFALAAAATASLVLLVFGRPIVHLWTGGRVRPDELFFALMVLTVLADVPWQLCTSVLRSANRHQLVGIVYLGTCAVSLLCARLLLPVIGLPAAPIALFLLDIVVTPVAFLQARALFRDGAAGRGRGGHRADDREESAEPLSGHAPRHLRAPAPVEPASSPGPLPAPQASTAATISRARSA